ncbi:AAA family ATPase [Dongshaea marina]|uniref:AAA family ATPase n=1 Tax=Dongshaea marina TaxID=2047966 RepID=UPI000D3E2009|nr:hypothetical protein [Dongshaea marina]
MDSFNLTTKVAIFYQSPECRHVLESALEFEGMQDVTAIENKVSKIADLCKEQELDIALLDCSQESDLQAAVDRSRFYFSARTSVIVVGCDQSISVQRQLKKQGIYYLYWPAHKSDVCDLLDTVSNDRRNNRRLGVRNAKRIAVLGVKGGVGTSVVSSQLAYMLERRHHLNTLLVDNSFGQGDLDLLLNIPTEDLHRHQLDSTLLHYLDESAALSLLYKHSESFQLLSLQSQELNVEQLRTAKRQVMGLLADHFNFILDDLSASVGFTPDLEYLAEHNDYLMLVSDSSVSSIRALSQMQKRFAELQQHKGHCQLLTAVNHARPLRGGSVLSNSEIKNYLKGEPDWILPYEARLYATLLAGKKLGREKFAQGIEQICNKLTGEKEREDLAYRLAKRLQIFRR